MGKNVIPTMVKTVHRPAVVRHLQTFIQSCCSQKSVHVVSATVQIHSDSSNLIKAGMKSLPGPSEYFISSFPV